MLTGIEKNFVTERESWDQLDMCSMVFMNCTLQADVAERVKSPTAQWVTIDTESSFVQVGLSETEFYEFDLNASLGDLK